MTNAQILLVEDENIVAKDVQNRLKSMGYGISGVASSGEEALEKAAETAPDLVLMDIVLKGAMDGVETSEHLRRRFHVPIIYLTAYADDSTLQRAKITEPFGYLLKPYEERELYTTIEMALYRHRMERKLAETERWLAAMLQSIGDAVIATDIRSRIQLINSVAETLTGWKAAEALGKDLNEVFHVINEQALDMTTSPLSRAFQQGTGVEFPAYSVLLNRDVEEVPIEGVVSPIHDEEGNFAGFTVVFRDVTQRRRSEEVQRQLEEQLHQAQKMEAIGRLAGGVAHDFNNILTAILGNVSLFLTSLPEDDPNRGCLETVEKAALRAADLVKQLLSFSRQTPLRLAPLNLNDAVEDSVRLIRPVVDPRISIQMDLASDPWTVQADATQMHQVILNLCLNARDAMPEGGRLYLETENVVVREDRSAASAVGRPGEFVCLRVRDTGHGIAPEIRGRVFEPFFTTKELGKGTGLGLSMVLGIVEQHHGWIDGRFDVEPGTRFDVYLPRYGQVQETAPLFVMPEPAQIPEEPEIPAPAERSPTILLTDDEPMVLELGRFILEEAGYQVLLAHDGVEAVKVYRQWRNIDLVILDLTMPRLSGTDAFLKMLELNPNVQVLFTSGYFAEDVPVADNAHVLGFIGKPYRREELLRVVRDALERVRTPCETESFL